MRRDERGLSASVESSLILPALILFVGLLVSLARLAIADQQLEVAVASAARAASLERSSAAAQGAAAEAFSRALGERSLHCRSADLDVDTAGLGRSIGQFASVQVEARCVVGLGDVSLPFVPGAVTISAHGSSPVDPLRGN